MAWNMNSLGSKKSQAQYINMVWKSNANIAELINMRLIGKCEDVYFNSFSPNNCGIAVLLKDEAKMQTC